MLVQSSREIVQTLVLPDIIIEYPIPFSIGAPDLDAYEKRNYLNKYL